VIRVSQTLENERRTYGASAEGEIGEIYLELENFPEAVRRMEAAVVGLERIYGSQHPRMLIGLANLALAQSKTNSDAARATVVKMRELAASLPSEDWRAVTIPFLEGQIREDRGECASALPFYRDALPRFSKVYGPSSAQTADVHERIGACLLATGQRREALAELEQVLVSRRTTGDTPNAVAAAAFELARALASGKRPSERARALGLAQEARTAWQQDGISDKLRELDQWLSAHGGVPTHSPLPVTRSVASKN
jgi:tetratricopeptide (TPR) repeat protein